MLTLFLDTTIYRVVQGSNTLQVVESLGINHSAKCWIAVNNSSFYQKLWLKLSGFSVSQGGSSVFSYILFLVFYESVFDQRKVLSGCSGDGCLAKVAD